MEIDVKRITVSVIIPVFNLREYISRCLDSVIRQTHQNLEIIVVDDGSSDGSGDIADDYAGRDKRIRVIHQKNGGLSAARNSGIDIASGEWNFFLDGDDVISSDAIQKLLEAACDSGANMSMCAFYWWFGDKRVHRSEHVPDGREFSGEKLQEYFLTDGVNLNYVCLKLYHRSVFSGIRFPQGREYEDIYVQAEIADAAGSCVFVDEPLYYYYQRPDSITWSGNERGLSQGVEASVNTKKYIGIHHPGLLPYASDRVMRFCCLVMGMTWKKADGETFRHAALTFKDNMSGAVKRGIFLKAAVFVYSVSPVLLGMSCALYTSIKKGIARICVN